MSERRTIGDLFEVVEDPTIPEDSIVVMTDMGCVRTTWAAPPASELPPPGPSNILVRTPSPLPAPKRVEDQ